MKRRTFLQAIGAFLAAPMAFFGAKKTEPVPSLVHPHLTDNNQWFLQDESKDILWSKPGTLIVPQSLYDDAVRLVNGKT